MFNTFIVLKEKWCTGNCSLWIVILQKHRIEVSVGEDGNYWLSWMSEISAWRTDIWKVKPNRRLSYDYKMLKNARAIYLSSDKRCHGTSEIISIATDVRWRYCTYRNLHIRETIYGSKTQHTLWLAEEDTVGVGRDSHPSSYLILTPRDSLNCPVGWLLC